MNIAQKWYQVVGCRLCHVFSGYENQTNIARKWPWVAGKRIREKPLVTDTRMHDNIVPWALRALGTKIYKLLGQM